MSKDIFIEVDTILGKEEIHLVQYGQGNAHFLVWHGFDSVNRFYPWKYLLKYGRVTLVGLPGHGPVKRRNWAHCKRWTQAYFVETAIAISRRLFDGKPLTLVGHSTGALVALGVALHAPEIVARAVLINPLIWSPKHKIIRYLVASKLWPVLGRIFIGGKLLRKQSSVDACYKEIDKIVRDHESVYANPDNHIHLLAGHSDYQQTSMNAYLGAARAVVTGDFRLVISDAHCKVPTLILHGDEDPVAPVSQSEWLVRNMANTQLIKRRGVGHVSYTEREQEFIEILTGWLDRHQA